MHITYLRYKRKFLQKRKKRLIFEFYKKYTYFNFNSCKKQASVYRSITNKVGVLFIVVKINKFIKISKCYRNEKNNVNN